MSTGRDGEWTESTIICGTSSPQMRRRPTSPWPDPRATRFLRDAREAETQGTGLELRWRHGVQCDGGEDPAMLGAHPPEGRSGAGGVGTPLRRSGLAGSPGGGEALPSHPRDGKVAAGRDEGCGGATLEGVGPPMETSGAGRTGGACAPEVLGKTLERVVVVGGGGSRCP